MRNINQIDIFNKRVLIRTDFNVPIIRGKIQSYFRLESTLETINYCINHNAKIIIMSHMGRPVANEKSLSLFPIIAFLKHKFKSSNIKFCNNCISESSFKITSNMLNKDIVLLENLRYYKEELDNDSKFAFLLSKHAEIYINDAFGTSHREHASNAAILKYYKENKGIGFLFNKELKYLSTINFSNSKKLTIILGGAKISSKIGMLKYFLDKCNNILIGGAMAFTFIKACGHNIGNSLFEEKMLGEAKQILDDARKRNVNIILPKDLVCSTDFSEINKIKIRSIDNIKFDEMGLDIGQKSIKKFNEIIKVSDIIIWNGPLGAFEMKSYAKGTEEVAKYITTFGNSKISIVGGGDTASAIIKLNLENKFTHVSTGGGASLELLSGRKLKFIQSWEMYD